MADADRLPPRLWWVLTGLTFAWGFNWSAMKVALHEVTPWVFRSLCLGLGAAVLFLVLRASGQKLAVLWISFDAVEKDAALEFVRGSHRGPLYDGSRFDPDDDTAPLYGDGTMPRLPDIERERDRFEIVSFPVEPGDVVAFHPSMLHGGAPTPPGGRRRTLSLRFFGDDVRYAPRAGFSGMLPDEPTTWFEELPARLQPGDAFRHPGFPKVRPL